MAEIAIQTAGGTRERYPLVARPGDDRPLARERHLPARPVALAPPRGDPRSGADGYWVSDLGSKNGTLLNGEPRARAGTGSGPAT